MHHLKDLMLSKPYFERVPDQHLVVDPGERYQYLAATRGEAYAMIYTYTGRDITVRMGKITGDQVKARWFDPRTGEYQLISDFDNNGIREFDPPGEPAEGNDWVLVLESL